MTPSYMLRVYDQLRKWVNGIWEHNKTDDECTPDFGCCRPALQEKDAATRLNYAIAWRKRNGIKEPVS